MTNKLICTLSVIAAGAFGLAGTVSAQTPEATPERPMGTSSMAGFSSGKKAAINAPKKGGTAANTTSSKGGAASLAANDKAFLTEAAKGGMMEVHMGQMAEKQGQSDAVKNLGKQMVTDHSKANSELMGLAQKKGLKLDTSHKMAKLDSKNFDQAYLSMMMQDHQKDIAAFEKEAKSGTDADVKSWAGKTLPTLKKHLKMVKDAQGKASKKA